MKFFALPLLFCFLLLNTQYVFAASSDPQLAKYDKEIESLTKNITKLQKQLAELVERREKRLSQLEESPAAKVQNLSSLAPAGETWGKRFKTVDIPMGAFVAHYFDTTNPSKLLKKEMVDSIDINYAWSEGPGFTVTSENFGGYWVGKFSLEKTQAMTLYVSQSWSEARVILDGRVIYKGDTNSVSQVIVPKGVHVLEVEYTNNWHTTRFSAMLIPTDKAIKEVPKGYLEGLDVNEVWLGGVYESSAFDNAIKLKKQGGSTASKVLLLSSYSAVEWDASEMKGSGVKAIVVSSYDPGSRVVNVPPGVAVYSSPGFAALYESDKVYRNVRALMGRPLPVSFAGSYGANQLVLPGQTIN